MTADPTPADDAYAAWFPEQATDDPDGLPDRAIVPLVESLRERGIVTLQSCYGHLGSDDGQLWVRADSVDGAHIRRFLTGDPFDRVQFVYQPDAPHWEFIWHAARADAALEALATLLPAVTSVDPTPVGLTAADLAAIETRAEAATPGPWRWTGKSWIEPAAPIDITEADWGPDGHDRMRLITNEGYGAWRVEDVQFVAHARQDVPALLARVRQLDGQLAHVRAAMGERIADRDRDLRAVMAERDAARRDGGADALRWAATRYGMGSSPLATWAEMVRDGTLTISTTTEED